MSEGGRREGRVGRGDGGIRGGVRKRLSGVNI